MLRVMPLLLLCASLPTRPPSVSPTTLEPTASPTTCFSDEELRYIYAFIGPSVPRPPDRIVVDLGNWYTSELSGDVAMILLKEVLGYNVEAVRYASEQNPDESMKRLANNITDVNFEVWLSKDGPGQFQPSVQRYLDKMLVYSAGPLGSTGTQGWFVPTSLVKDMLSISVDMDFWRTYSIQRASSPEAYAALNAGGRVNDSLWVAPPFIPLWCMLSANNVTKGKNATFAPACPEIVSLTPAWGEGALPQIVVNNQFRFQVAYVGENIDAVVEERVESKRPVIFYSWTPTRFMTKYGSSFTRIALPPFSESCYANNTRDPRGFGSVDCDYPPVPIFKMYGWRIQELSAVQSTTQQNAFADLVRFMKLFSLENSDLEWMLSRPEEEAAFQTACSWLKECTNKKTPTPPSKWASHAPSAPPTLRSRFDNGTSSPTPEPTPFPGLITCDWFNWVRNTPMNYVQDLNPFYVVLSMSAAGVLAGITMIFQFLLWRNRKNPIIRATAPRLCQVMLIGSYLGCASVIVSAQGQHYRQFCILFPTLFGCAFVLVFGSLTLKNRRIHQIFNRSAPTHGSSEKPASDAKLIQNIVALLGCELTLNMLWFAFNGPRVELVNSSGGRSMHWSCTYEQTVVYVVIFLTPKAIMVMYAMWVSWKVRNVNDQFNESPKLAFSAYTTVIFGGFGLGIGVADISNDELFLINSMLILVGILSNILVLLVPKMWAIYYLPPSPNFDPARWSPSRSQSHNDDPQVSRLRRRLVDSTRQIEQLKRLLKDNGLEIPLLSVAEASQTRGSITR